MSEPTAPEGAENVPAASEEEVVPDYSRVGFRDLQRLCKVRGLPGDGKAPDLIERLKAHDIRHGKAIDLTIPEDEEVDLLADDEPDAATPEQPVGGGEAASAPSPTGVLPSANLPHGGSVTSAAPAVVVVSSPDEPKGLPRAATANGRVDLTTRDGQVKVGEGHGAVEVRAFRREFPHGPREIDDSSHFTYIAETHAAAWAEGLATKGGVTIGQRVGEGVDADGRRTVIYQVPLKRQQ